MAYAPALPRGSPDATYQAIASSLSSTKLTRVTPTSATRAVALANGDTGQDVVSPARKLAQHRTGFRIIGRLAERLFLGQDNGICPEDHSVRMPRGHDCRLGRSEACHIRPRRFG